MRSSDVRIRKATALALDIQAQEIHPMKWFRKSPPPQPVIADPFAVIPIQPDDVAVRRDSRGHIHLRRLPPTFILL
jgi:hypothetical protein